MLNLVMKQETIPISTFKAKCLGLLEKTRKRGAEYTITKHGEPIAKVIPIHKSLRGSLSSRGSLKGWAEIKGDIVHFDTSEDWDVLKE